jgi:hypothetical protein
MADQGQTTWRRYGQSIGLFTILGPLISALVIVVKGALESQVAFWPGYFMTVIPIWRPFL